DFTKVESSFAAGRAFLARRKSAPRFGPVHKYLILYFLESASICSSDSVTTQWKHGNSTIHWRLRCRTLSKELTWRRCRGGRESSLFKLATRLQLLHRNIFGYGLSIVAFH